MARVMTSGMVKTSKILQWIIRSQVLSHIFLGRWYGCSSTTKWQWAFIRFLGAQANKCLRYSLTPCESKAFWEESQWTRINNHWPESPKWRLFFNRKRKRKAWINCCTHRPSLLPIGWLSEVFGLRGNCSNVNALREIDQTWSSRGSKSRNKVSVAQSIVLEHYRDDNAPSAVTLAEALAARKGALCDCK